jgi:hypothetical protein
MLPRNLLLEVLKPFSSRLSSAGDECDDDDDIVLLLLFLFILFFLSPNTYVALFRVI